MEAEAQDARRANDGVLAFANRFHDGWYFHWEFLCECGCLGPLARTVDEYRRYGAWLPGHEPDA
jgi:hypothetical protein